MNPDIAITVAHDDDTVWSHSLLGYAARRRQAYGEHLRLVLVADKDNNTVVVWCWDIRQCWRPTMPMTTSRSTAPMPLWKPSRRLSAWLVRREPDTMDITITSAADNAINTFNFATNV